MTGLQGAALSGEREPMFTSTHAWPSFETDPEEVPSWSGQFEMIGEGVAIMRVHNADARQHRAPEGWRAAGHSTFEDGSFETFVFHKFDQTHDHMECPECGV